MIEVTLAMTIQGDRMIEVAFSLAIRIDHTLQAEVPNWKRHKGVDLLAAPEEGSGCRPP